MTTPRRPASQHRIPVTSSTVASIGYDGRTAALCVEFVNGDLYEYYGVEPAVFEAFLAAESHGRFFNREVRGRYHYAKVD